MEDLSVSSIRCSAEQLAGLIGGRLLGEGATQLSRITDRHEEVSGGGALFIALRGVRSDGHDYIERALSAGAAAVVAEKVPAGFKGTAILVKSSRLALSQLAAYFSGEPAKKMRIIAVTGTNGKSSINWMLYQLYCGLEGRALRLGTLGSFSEGIIDDPDTLTSPGALYVHPLLARAQSAGVRTAVLEVSSHALDQRRLDHIEPDAAIFTNLTRDHLDYHLSMESYFEAKARLFQLLRESSKPHKLAVVNVDDPYGARLCASHCRPPVELISYGFHDNAECRIVQVDQSPSGMQLELDLRGKRIALESRMIGLHNAGNIAAVAAVWHGFGGELDLLSRLLRSIPQVPGRLERVPCEDLQIYVDYSHTPDSLDKALRALRPVVRGRLWAVIGCGGDRDRGKRPLMGRVAAELADEVVVTSDNPRTERPESILAEILPGCPKARVVEVDRRRAICFAVAQAAPGDTLLIAGKGHENYQIIGTEKHHFSDVEEAAAAAAQRCSQHAAAAG